MSSPPPSSPRYALLSVSDKQGLLPLAHALLDAGYTLLSTGGTARTLLDAGLEVVPVSHMTRSPELLQGRVKTLHPRIHAALLARRDDPAHLDELVTHDIPLIDLLVVNLYPFAHTIASPEVTLEQATEQIDIGGPAMLRAAAKNFAHVLPICAPEDYGWLIESLQRGEPIEMARRRALAAKVFAHTASYDALVARYLLDESLPDTLHMSWHKTLELRYGENPHQRAALYHLAGDAPLAGARKLHGKALSYNNIVDLDAALSLVQEFSTPCVAIIKHTNPAGCACHTDLATAYAMALESDPTSAFGGIVALNRPVDQACALAMHDHFFEVIAAPDFSAEALDILTRKKNVRLLCTPPSFFDVSHDFPDHPEPRMTALGLLAQQRDPPILLDLTRCHVPTQRAPSPSELEELAFAWRVCKHVKSNAIVLTSGQATVGVGAGQMSRVDAVQLAISRARTPLHGAVLASDAFFPFADGPQLAIDAGVTAIVQPGGSVRDQQIIDVCDAHDIAMIFTGERHFRH